MMRFVSSDFIERPGVEAFGCACQEINGRGRIYLDELPLQRVGEDLA